MQRGPLPGDGAALYRERVGRALVQVRELGDAHRQLRLAGERLGQHRRRDLPGLEHRGHLGQRVVREVRPGHPQPVIGQRGRGQQVQDVPRRVHADGLAFEVGQRPHARARHHVQALGPRLHHRAFGEDVQVGGDHGIAGRGGPLALVVVFLRLDVADVVAARDVDPVARLGQRLGVDDRRGTDRRDEGDMQALRREQALVQGDEETGRVDGGHHGDVQVRLLDAGCGGVPAAGKPGHEQDGQDDDGRDGAEYLGDPDCPRELAWHRRLLSSSRSTGPRHR